MIVSILGDYYRVATDEWVSADEWLARRRSVPRPEPREPGPMTIAEAISDIRKVTRSLPIVALPDPRDPNEEQS